MVAAGIGTGMLLPTAQPARAVAAMVPEYRSCPLSRSITRRAQLPRPVEVLHGSLRRLRGRARDRARGGWTGYGHEPTRGEFRRVCMTVQFLGWYRAQLAAGP